MSTEISETVNSCSNKKPPGNRVAHSTWSVVKLFQQHDFLQPLFNKLNWHCDVLTSLTHWRGKSEGCTMYIWKFVEFPFLCGTSRAFKWVSEKLPAFYISSKEVSDTQRLLSENTIFFERGSKALHKLRLSLLKRPERDEVLCKRSALQRDQLGSIIYLFRFVPELFLYGHTNNAGRLKSF